MDAPIRDRARVTELPAQAPEGALRIALLSYRSPPHVGGQGVYVDYLSRALVRAGHQVDVLSGPPYPALDPAVRLVRIPSLDLYAQPHNGHFALRPRHLLSPTDTYEYFGHLSGKFVEPETFGARVGRYLARQRHDYDVILDNQTLARGTLTASKRLGLPMVTMIHHPITQDRRLALAAAENWRQRWLVRRWYKFHAMQVRVARQLATMTCPSEAAKADIVAEFGVDPARITPIPLGVDRDAFRPMPELARHPARIVTTASADVPLKGLPILIEAVSRLLPDHPDLEIIVIGKLREGPTRALIERLGLGERITFRSGLTREALARTFAEATLAVTPSLYEGFGLPAAEAMSCATPVVVTDGGALPEVAGDAGLIVPRGNAAELANAISGLLKDPERRRALGQAGAARAAERFDWAAIAPRYEALLRQAMADASC